MGNWAIHVEGHGIHDNGKPEDADQRLRQFVDTLAGDGHLIHSASIVIGPVRELVNSDETTPLRSGEHAYRHQA